MASNKVNLNLPMPQVEIRLEGNWVGLDRLSYGMAASIKKGYDNATEKYSNLLLKTVRRAIKSGQPPPNSGVYWQPLSEETKKRWEDHKIYNLEGIYGKSIGIHRYKSRTFVGIPIASRPSNPNSKLTLNQVAIILEFGNNRIPARPLWLPSVKSLGGKERLKKEIMQGIRSQLYKEYGINPKQIR